MTDDQLDDVLDEAEELDDGPDEDSLKKAHRMCTELAVLVETRDSLDKELKETKKKIWEMQTKTIPDFMLEREIDHIGLPEHNSDVKMKTAYKANIAADWDEDRRQAAFDHLVELECQDVIRTQVTYTLGADSFETAVAIHTAISNFASMLVDTNFEVQVPEPVIGKSVPWATLTALVKDLSEKGVAFDTEKLGATVGPFAEIKERK